MSAKELPADVATVADTVVVNYFLTVGQLALLATIVGAPIRVPRAVYDPEENPAGPEETLSELRKGLHLHERRSVDGAIPKVLQRRSQAALPEFQQLEAHFVGGLLVCEDLSADELLTYAKLRDAAQVKPHGVAAGLGRGEAAALAIGLSRTWRVATDDNDAIKVAQALRPALPILRIRGLLKTAVAGQIITLQQARGVHQSMVQVGFWDKGHL